MRLNRVQFLLTLGLCALSGAAACPTTTGSATDSGPGTTDRFCSVTTDCNEFEECVGGICQRPCGTDDVCEFGQFCTHSGYCLAGCRDTPSCPDPDNQLCVDGICKDKNSVGTCATKADCTMPPDTLVCKDGQCINPPATCAGPQDCPGPGQCNGFTHACFNPNGECMTTPDCATKPQCTSGCTCTMDRRCVATPVCTLMTEASVCGQNSYCDTAQMPNRCASSPTCQRQADCDSAHLACNRTLHVCERSPTCTTDTPCAAAAPFTKCNTSAGVCQEPTCNNGGLACQSGETCGTDGRCTMGTTTPCTTNAECMPTQYCDPSGCRPGCRNDANCNATIGEKCNGAHVCAIPSGSSSSGGTGGGDGTACPNGDGDCRVGYACAPFTTVCRETCSGGCPPCPQTGYGCFIAYCSPAAAPPEPTPDGGFICE